MACAAIEDKSVRRTSAWPRQSGATATAIAMLVENPDVVIVSALPGGSDRVVKRVNCFSLTEQKNMIDRKHSRCFTLTDKVRSTGIRPKLIIFDSCTAFRDVEDHAREACDMYQCGILIFPSDVH